MSFGSLGGLAAIAKTSTRSAHLRTIMTAPTWKRLIRFIAEDGQEHLGQPVDESIDIGAALADSQTIQAHLLSSNSPLDPSLSVTGTIKTVRELLSPVSSKDARVVHCVGLNYKDHAEECGLAIPQVPCLFVKTANSIGNPNGQLNIPKMAQGEAGFVDYEVELAIVFNKTFKDISEEDAMSVVLGYTAANDVSARAHQFATPQWSFSKSFDGFCPLGPTLVHPSQIANAHALQLGTTLNSNTMQSSSTSQLIFPLAKIIAFISQGTTIEAGSVLITGTPPGIGYSREPKVYLKHGDVVKCYLQGVGTLVSNVVYEK